MVKFTAKGHKNILATQRNTLEFTKDKELTLEGDCIIGVESDFSLENIKPALTWKKAKMIITVDGEEEVIIGEMNKDFCNNNEIVLRKTAFTSDRTLMIYCDKSSAELSRDFVKKLKSNIKITVILEEI